MTSKKTFFYMFKALRNNNNAVVCETTEKDKVQMSFWLDFKDNAYSAVRAFELEEWLQEELDNTAVELIKNNWYSLTGSDPVITRTKVALNTEHAVFVAIINLPNGWTCQDVEKKVACLLSTYLQNRADKMHFKFCPNG